jgi:carbonic anhydrase
MTADFSDLLEANAAYAERNSGAGLLPPGASLAVVTCIDARIEPLAALGLTLGEAMVVRNPGGQVTDEALAALAVGVHRLGVRRILVMQHTDCAMAKIGDDDLRSVTGDATPLRVIPDQRERLREDVERIRASPSIPDDLPVLGAILDLHTRRLGAL